MADEGTLRGLRALVALPGVAEAAETAREACTQLRFEEALRRRIPEAAAESRVRGARASAALDGAELPVSLVRDLVRGAVAWAPVADPVERVVRGAVQATAETERVAGLVLAAPLQALARLHVAATGGDLTPAEVGRPRVGTEEARELVEVGPAPSAGVAAERLGGWAPLLAAVGHPDVPAVVVAALVHAEVAVARPFVRGNGLVARALERAVVQASGLDPTGVAVPEVGHLRAGPAAYVGALAAYATGSPAGVGVWLQHGAAAVTEGAEEGRRICAAVRVGRLA